MAAIREPNGVERRGELDIALAMEGREVVLDPFVPGRLVGDPLNGLLALGTYEIEKKEEFSSVKMKLREAM